LRPALAPGADVLGVGVAWSMSMIVMIVKVVKIVKIVKIVMIIRPSLTLQYE
jgi:hypothetical protein